MPVLIYQTDDGSRYESDRDTSDLGVEFFRLQLGILKNKIAAIIEIKRANHWLIYLSESR